MDDKPVIIKADLTPMMRQYYEIKAQAGEAIMFFRLGDFYEMFDQDALLASQILGITLTARSKGENRIPMCGIPYHSAAGYIAKLTRAGHKVAICEQASDPSLPGIVKREIVKIITPGTTLDENILDEKTANYLAVLSTNGQQVGICWAELSAGEIRSMVVGTSDQLLAELTKSKPAEIIVEKGDFGINWNGWSMARKMLSETFWHEEALAGQSDENGRLSAVNANELEQRAVDLAMNYLAVTQKRKLTHLGRVESENQEDFVNLDESTIRNLELLQSSREKSLAGSFLQVVDKTITAGGGRMLKQLIVRPLANKNAIEKRQSQIEWFLANSLALENTRESLKKVLDIERILGRLSLGSGNARDIRALAESFKNLAEIKNYLFGFGGVAMVEILNKIDLLENLIGELDKSIVIEPPFSIREGGMIAEGVDQSLDELKNIASEGKGFIQALQTREVQRTGINSLKVKYNKIFGYYIEISNANLAQVPEDYTRRQTLANAERFTTPELKEYEEKVLTAQDKIMEIEGRIFEELRQKIINRTEQIKATARATAYLDNMAGMAALAWENRYVKAQITENYDLMIKGGRHPVIEKLNPQDRFIANDLSLVENSHLMLITGPNMGGKSTYLRQNALIVLMAHLGMYVPADQAVISLVDKIFTRVGASDNLVRGQSTFWVEMEETAHILNNATRKSLIILDEIGRGTSTFDGVSIAWGVVEYLQEKIGAKTIFASHYHELIALVEALPAAVNHSVKVTENEKDGVVFLYKIGQGGIDKSYGIEVAKLAGLPAAVTGRAREILVRLEAEKLLGGRNEKKEEYSGLFAVERTEQVERKHAGLEKLREIDLNSLTPLEALNKLHELKKSLNE